MWDLTLIMISLRFPSHLFKDDLRAHWKKNVGLLNDTLCGLKLSDWIFYDSVAENPQGVYVQMFRSSE